MSNLPKNIVKGLKEVRLVIILSQNFLDRPPAKVAQLIGESAICASNAIVILLLSLSFLFLS